MPELAKTIVVQRNVERERMASPVVPVQSVKPCGAMPVPAKTIVPVGSAGNRRSWKSCAGRAPIDPGVMRGSAKTTAGQLNVAVDRTVYLVVHVRLENRGGAMKMSAKTTARVATAGILHSWKCLAGRAPTDPGAMLGSAKTTAVLPNVAVGRTAYPVVRVRLVNLGGAMKVSARTIVMDSNAVSRPYWMLIAAPAGTGIGAMRVFAKMIVVLLNVAPAPTGLFVAHAWPGNRGGVAMGYVLTIAPVSSVVLRQ